MTKDQDVLLSPVDIGHYDPIAPRSCDDWITSKEEHLAKSEFCIPTVVRNDVPRIKAIRIDIDTMIE